MKPRLLLCVAALSALVLGSAACSSFTTTNASSEAALSPNAPGAAFGVDAGGGGIGGPGFNNGSNGGGTGVSPTSGH